MSRNRIMDRAFSTGELTSEGFSRTMHHSHSTPAGVDGGARTPPTTPKKGGKMLAVRVQMLDDSITMFQIQAKALGRVLFDQVCKQLHLLEADYFGLEYQDLSGTRYWLDLQKPVSRQLGLSLIDPLLRFCVKFYTPDPGQLEEEFTRYLFCLQIKRDLAQGHLQCNDNTAALMASYIVQAECGDYVAEDYPDHTYLSSYKFIPHQDHDLECRIMDSHKKHAGQSPAEADLNLLETARRCELYGMKMHQTKDHEGVALNLSVAHIGIVVFQHFSKINTFSWAKIRKISFKRKRFLIKLHPESYAYYKDLVEFYFETRNECKNFWKKCVEHHGFFRCVAVKNVSRHKTRVISRGSSFRYSGKTQKQMVEFVRDNYVKRQTFQRSASFRHSAHSSAVNVHAVSVGTSISAHPLLPLADPSLVELLDKASRKELAQLERGAFRTTRLAYRHPATATPWPVSAIQKHVEQSVKVTPAVDTPVMMSSPSPPLMTQSVSVEICTNTTPEIDVKSSRTTVMDYPDDAITDNTQASYEIPITTPPTFSSPPKYSPKSEQSLQRLNYNNQPQRSASCRDLYDFDTTPVTITKNTSERKLESPITRYDDSHRSLYSNRNISLDIQQDIIVLDHKVYSSSYPGTLSQESVEDPGNYELGEDDLSHDSYELLERSDDDLSGFVYQKRGSLDSGNYLQSDTDSDRQDIFLMDDPRDLPREINPPKSDGSFYRIVKLSSRTSSVESKSDYYDSISSSKKLSKVSSRSSSMESNETKPKIVGEILKEPVFVTSPTVHSISLQNVDSTPKCIEVVPEDNIFSFDEEKIKELNEIDHPVIERTKSDPNVTNRQRLCSSSRRHTLMHQKSIDAESSDDDFLYRIAPPSAPPLSKSFYTAEFGHFDILQTEESKFEVPKSQFEVLGAKTQFDLINLPPKDDIPYILHKRHVMNGTVPKIESPPPKVEVESPFLFTQNIDLSNVNPVTLEVDKNDLPVLSVSPKRDITKIDPIQLETLNMKLSRIESDSPPHAPKIDIKNVLKAKYNSDMAAKLTRAELKPKRIKNKKGSKNKIRITSFSSDDESLDSDDVFGTTEATPTKLELSPPQHRKEMESILKFESERQTHLQYTMSSTEVEGSPPQPRKELDYNLEVRNTELRRISERSLSIPSSEDDPPVAEMPPTTIKSTELILNTVLRHGTPSLFAHARLNLSEGTGFTLMQRQATLQSPTSTRRAKSLDTAVVSFMNLPPPTAFSSKDDTLEIEEEPPLEPVKVEQPVKVEVTPKPKPPKKSKRNGKSKSFEKVDVKKVTSKERSKSQDDNELNLRRKKQQILYETAIKQTKTLKSPVKETLPQFPIVEDSVSVSDGKLEIKIDVKNSTIPDDAIIITKSPKKLDKKLLSKSLELNFPDDPFGTEKQVGRLGQSLDLDPRRDDSDSKPTGGDTSEETSDIESDVEVIPETKILKKMSTEKSEDTTSWITVECEEYIGFDDEEVNEKVIPKLSDTRSRSSDTTGSWTSGEKDLSPIQQSNESSVSCSIIRPFGISQVIEKYDTREQLENELVVSSGPRSPLKRSSPVDEESSSSHEEAPRKTLQSIKTSSKSSTDSMTASSFEHDKVLKSKYPFEQKWLSETELIKTKSKVSSEDSSSDKPRIHSLEKLSIESKTESTESSSGSLGVAYRQQKTGEAPIVEASSTWRPFLMESSGSSSLEDGILPPDVEDKEYYLDKETYNRFDDTVTPTDLLPNYNAAYLSRTLSRISERSSNSEKSSLEDTESVSASLSLDKPTKIKNGSTLLGSNLTRQISDDRRTSAEMADLSLDEVELILTEDKLRRQNSDDTIIEEEHSDGIATPKLKCESSQESEDWPLPEIPSRRLSTVPSLNDSPPRNIPDEKYYNIPKIFGLRASFQSEDSGQWPSPPESQIEEVEVKTTYIEPEKAVVVDLESKRRKLLSKQTSVMKVTPDNSESSEENITKSKSYSDSNMTTVLFQNISGSYSGTSKSFKGPKDDDSLVSLSEWSSSNSHPLGPNSSENGKLFTKSTERPIKIPIIPRVTLQSTKLQKSISYDQKNEDSRLQNASNFKTVPLIRHRNVKKSSSELASTSSSNVSDTSDYVPIKRKLLRQRSSDAVIHDSDSESDI